MKKVRVLTAEEAALLVNLSGRGDKDIDYVAERIGMTGEADEIVR